jgi:O-methyltransferase
MEQRAQTVKLSRVGRMARKPWFGIWRLIEEALYVGREYTVQVPHGRRVLTPWFDEASEFGRIQRSVRNQGGPSPDSNFMLHQLVRRCLRLPGDMAECGVFRGSSAKVIATTLANRKAPTRLHLFDTFEGTPAVWDPSHDYTRPGTFGDTSLEQVRRCLADHLERCAFYRGIMPDTFAEVPEGAMFSLVNVDVGLYATEKACAEFFWPRLVPGGAMLFGPYGLYPYRRATRRAVDEFFASAAEEPILLPSGQALLIKGVAEEASGRPPRPAEERELRQLDNA